MKTLFKLILLAALATPSTLVAKDNDVKSIILLIGDGMGLSHITMSMIEQSYEPTIFDLADNIALQKTYSANNRVTDSAAAATALATGYKTNNSMLGVTPDGTPRESIASLAASQLGKSCGVVATVAVHHATPAAFYAHVKSRNNYEEIATQLANSSLSVAIGGGARNMNEELINQMKGNGFSIATTMEELQAANSDKLLALLAPTGLKSIEKGRDPEYLAKATTKALEILSKDEEGFFLMVEGSQIDYTSHDNNTNETLQEMYDFERAVKVAVEYARQHEDVLVIVTADHETGGLSLVSNNEDFTKSDSGVAYRYGTKGHSGILIPILLYGAGAEEINGIMENTELSRKMMEIIGVEQ